MNTRKEVLSVEAETASLEGNTYVTQAIGASGESVVSGFSQDKDRATVLIDVSREGFYDFSFLVKSQGGHKENYVYLDDLQIGYIACDEQSFEEARLKRVFLTEGEHFVSLEKYWGFIDWDKLTLYESENLDKNFFKVDAKLCNPNASDNAKRLMNYLSDTYGTAILSGQYAEGGYASWEVFKLKENNGGKAPAVIGLEMGHCNQTAIDYDFTHPSVESAESAWEQGGIVTMCYHWLAPEKYIKGIWWNGFRTEAVDIPLEKIVNGEDPEGLELLLNDIEILAKQLKVLADQDIPILWRPLHEASGGWFWWGAHGAETYKKLYVLLYEQLTDVYGLNNLIWVWNGQDKDWYPGDEYVDIVGIDIYPGERQYRSNIDPFLQLKSWTEEPKIVVLSENGTMPDIDACIRDNAMWGFFCTWEGEFVLSDGLAKRYSEQYTEASVMNAIYNHEKVITLDELPDLKTYRID